MTSTKKLLLTLPQWKSLCQRFSRDKPQPRSFFLRPREAEEREPENKVSYARYHHEKESIYLRNLSVDSSGLLGFIDT